jgi:putative acetyltransferase
MNLVVRSERSEERSEVRLVNEAAFICSNEAELVDQLRSEGVVLLSLVAEMESQIVSHILFSRMSIQAHGGSISAVALAPMTVLPRYQRSGIGGRLIRSGLEILRDCSEEIIVVLGHPGYYPRFGFSTEKARALESPFPPDAFMAIELTPGALDGVRGIVKYPNAFGL